MSARLFSILFASIITLSLASCGKDSAPPENNPAATSENAVQPSVSASPAVPKPAPPASHIDDLPRYSPNVDEVKRAFLQLLVEKAMTLPDTPARGVWFRAEVDRLDKMKVSKCAETAIGSPSTCQVSISGNTVQLNFLLTTSGWMLVR